MASSNRHWPSLFKSKPCNSHHQGHHDISSSTLLKKPPHTSGTLPGCEERSPEPKPRWNPKPEQIRILEAIFNSGMVNPPRDEIRRIRAQLQEYGQVGDANVFYWFQNRKSRSKQKQRHLQATRQQQSRPTGNAPSLTTVSATTSSFSSSSERSNGSDKTVLTGMTVGGLAGVLHASNSPTASANQGFLQGGFLPEPFYFQAMQQGCYFSLAEMPAGLVVVPEQALGLWAGMFSELPSQQLEYKVGEDGMEMNVHQTYRSAATVAATATAALATVATTTTTTTTTADSGANSDSTIAGHISGIIQGMGGGGCGVSRSTVFINEVAFEVGAGLFNVREAFGEDALLLHSSGHPVAVDERGVTLHPLQHGASYYLV